MKIIYKQIIFFLNIKFYHAPGRNVFFSVLPDILRRDLIIPNNFNNSYDAFFLDNLDFKKNPQNY